MTSSIFQLAEIGITYKSQVPAKDRFKITSSETAAQALKHHVFDPDTIGLYESFYLLCLNRANAVLGASLISKGGTSGTVVDIKIIFATALKAGASNIIVAHNHPSGSLSPSQADIDITKKIKQAGEIMQIPLLDHIILTYDNGYYSFADEGML